MITLFLDTSLSKLIVGLYKDNCCIAYKEMEPKKNLSNMVLPLISELFDKSNTTLKEVSKIFVVNGPGSFTGIRIGVTIAKTFAWSKDIPINTISSLELLSTTESDKKYIVPLIDARRDCFYAAMYCEDSGIIISEQYISRKDLFNKIKRHASLKDVEFVSYDDIPDIETIKPKLNIEKILNKYSNIEPLNPHLVNPNYLKRVEAEEKLSDKRN